jgi:hypothetical protein
MLPSVGKSRARRAEEEGAERFSSASDDEVGGSMRAMREQPQTQYHRPMTSQTAPGFASEMGPSK